MLVRQIARYVCIAIVVVVFFFPIYWMLITSMKPQEEVLYYPPTFVPPEVTFRYYVEAFDFRGGTALINSLIITSIVTIISTVLGTLGGYAFARYKVGGFHLPFWVLSTRMMPQVAAIIPIFLLMQQLGLIDRYAAVISVHLIVTLPFAIWMMRSFFLETPVELEEAALMDGASKWQLTDEDRGAARGAGHRHDRALQLRLLVERVPVRPRADPEGRHHAAGRHLGSLFPTRRTCGR